MSRLKNFAIAPQDDGYRLRFETQDGEAIEILASFEQLDLIAEEIDRQLDADQDPAH